MFTIVNIVYFDGKIKYIIWRCRRINESLNTKIILSFKCDFIISENEKQELDPNRDIMNKIRKRNIKTEFNSSSI